MACLRGLLRFYGLDSETDLRVAAEALPQLVLDCEVAELGIAAGLQDRVIQVPCVRALDAEGRTWQPVPLMPRAMPPEWAWHVCSPGVLPEHVLRVTTLRAGMRGSPVLLRDVRRVALPSCCLRFTVRDPNVCVTGVRWGGAHGL